MAEIICEFCGRIHEVPAFANHSCECGACWQADEDAGGNPSGEWEPPANVEAKQQITNPIILACGEEIQITLPDGTVATGFISVIEPKPDQLRAACTAGELGDIVITMTLTNKSPLPAEKRWTGSP